MRADKLVLVNFDLDSGEVTRAAEYSLADDTYAKLLARLADKKFDRTSPELRNILLQFYSDPSAPDETKQDPVRWQRVLAALDQLKSVVPSPAVTSGPAHLD